MKRPFEALSAEKVRKEHRLPPQEKQAKDLTILTLQGLVPRILHVLLLLFHSSLPSSLFQENFTILLTILLLLLCLHLQHLRLVVFLSLLSPQVPRPTLQMSPLPRLTRTYLQYYHRTYFQWYLLQY